MRCGLRRLWPPFVPFREVNDCVALDNRIPPLGFTGADDIDIQPVGYSYPETAPGSGVLVNYDDVSYNVAVPLGTPSPVTIEATLRYRTASKEYIEFLRDEAVDNNFPDDCIVGSGAQVLGLSRGEYLYELWNDPSYGRSPPVDMSSDSGSAMVTDELFADGFESGGTSAWSSSVPRGEPRHPQSLGSNTVPTMDLASDWIRSRCSLPRKLSA